ncbi:hypothetical protein FRC12_017898 [Ceratobasidium sp. 428]|nr:hypothetical protein FRC12_017898 [Ceratobasidium sp. 428]
MAEITSNTSRECEAFFNEDGSLTSLKMTDIGSPYTFKVADEDGPTALKGWATFHGSPSSQNVKPDEEDIIVTITEETQPIITAVFKKSDDPSIITGGRGRGHIFYRL